MQKQTPNEILLNYPKLKGGKGNFKRAVVPPRENAPTSRAGRISSSRLNSGRYSLPRVDLLAERSESYNNPRKQSEIRVVSPSDELKSKSVIEDDIDDVVKYRPTFVARMSGLTYIRSPSPPKHSRRRINSATSRIARPRTSSFTTTSISRPQTAASHLSAPAHFRLDERSMTTPGAVHSSEHYRWMAMAEVGRYRDTERGGALTPQDLVESLRQESRQRRLKRMTPQDFLFHKRSRNQATTVLAQYFSLRMAFRVIRWKNKALHTLAKNRENTEEIEKRKVHIKTLFKTRARAIMLIYRWYKSLVAFSMSKTERSSLELQWEENFLVEHKRKKFEFDIGAFEPQKKQNKLPKWAKIILQKAPSDRSKLEVKQLHDMFRGLSHFEKFTQKVQLELSRACTLMEIESMRVILREGHKGQGFYFIYTGSVFINKTETRNDRKKTQYQKTRAILTRGEAFGEVALLRDTSRKATVVAREPCELLCIDKDTFAKVCPQMFDDELKNRVAYMQTHDLFLEGWDTLALYNMALSSSVAEYSINQVISKNSTEDAEIYFVMEGFCTVVKCLLIDTSVQKSTVATSSKDVTSDMANGSEDSEPKSSSVDFADLLNDQMKAKKKGSAEALRKFSESQPITKNSLFQAMDMTYENDLSSASSAERKNQSAIDEIIREQKEMDLESKLQKQREKELKTMKDSTHSFTVFVSLTEKSARFQNKTAVFLQVGRLKEGDVFNIRDSMNTDSNQTDLILVSEKCKLLKVKVLDFVRSLRNQELFLFLTTKIKKMKTYCPDEKDMIKLYKRNCNWEAYGQSLVNKSKKKDLLKQKQEADLLLGKPWRADPEYWLAVLREKTRKMEIKTNQPLKPPIY